MTKTIPGSSSVFVLSVQYKTLLFYTNNKTANQLRHLLIRSCSRCPATSSHQLQWFNVTVRVKPTDWHGESRSCFCNPNFRTFLNFAALVYEYTELTSGFHHTFWASVFADKWIRESDSHIRCHGNTPCEGQCVLLWAHGTQNFLNFITSICYANYAAVVYTLSTVSV